LPEGRFDELDLANLIEEIEAMARKDEKAIKSNLVVLLTHLLKHQIQPERRSSGWRGRVVEHRQWLRDDFEESPSLRLHAADGFARAYADARERVSAETGLPLRALSQIQPLHLGADPRSQVPARLISRRGAIELSPRRRSGAHSFYFDETGGTGASLDNSTSSARILRPFRTARLFGERLRAVARHVRWGRAIAPT
jgi:Domain of unknown function DUF29